jgi:tetratricopeptide (TPR) repeat protein
MSFLWGNVSTTKGKFYAVLYFILTICAYLSWNTSFTLSNLSIRVSPIVILVITFIFFFPVPSLIKESSKSIAVNQKLLIVVLFIYLYFVLFVNLTAGIPSILVNYYGKDFSYEGFVSGKDIHRFGGATKSYKLKIGGNDTFRGDDVIVTYGAWKTAEKGQMIQISGKYFLLGRKILSAQLLGYDKKEVNYFQDHGMELSLKGKYDLALSYFNKVIELSPHNAKAYFNKGFTYFQLKKYNKALADFDKAIEIKSDYAAAYNNRGFVYIIKGEYDKAISDFNRAIEISPKYADAYSNRGRTYALKGELEKVCSDVNTGCKLGQCSGLDWAKEKGFCK